MALVDLDAVLGQVEGDLDRAGLLVGVERGGLAGPGRVGSGGQRLGVVAGDVELPPTACRLE